MSPYRWQRVLAPDPASAMGRTACLGLGGPVHPLGGHLDRQRRSLLVDLPGLWWLGPASRDSPLDSARPNGWLGGMNHQVFRCRPGQQGCEPFTSIQRWKLDPDVTEEAIPVALLLTQLICLLSAGQLSSGRRRESRPPLDHATCLDTYTSVGVSYRSRES
jgi:hypothetical protein